MLQGGEQLSLPLKVPLGLVHTGVLEGLDGHHDGVICHQEPVTQTQVDPAEGTLSQLLDEGDLVTADMTNGCQRGRPMIRHNIKTKLCTIDGQIHTWNIQKIGRLYDVN